MQDGAGYGYHVGEDLPVPAFDGHGAVGGHADHCFQPVDLVEVLGVVDACGSLDDIVGEVRADAAAFEVLLACHGGCAQDAELGCRFGKGFEGEVGRLVHLEEGAYGLLHEGLGANGGVAVFPEEFGNVPVPVAGVALGEDKLLSIPYAENFWCVEFARCLQTVDG